MEKEFTDQQKEISDILGTDADTVYAFADNNEELDILQKLVTAAEKMKTAAGEAEEALRLLTGMSYKDAEKTVKTLGQVVEKLSKAGDQLFASVKRGVSKPDVSVKPAGEEAPAPEETPADL